MEETHYHFWLTNIDGIGNATVSKLLSYAGNAHNIWDMSERELASVKPTIDKPRIKALLDSKNEEKIISHFESLQRKGINYIPDTDSLFPEKLKQIRDAPHCLYLKGLLPDPSKISVAVVGARTCSDYGRYVTRKISSYLAENGFQIISGMARGIDVISQKAALDSGGYSLAVLGCGVDICYPPENLETYNRLLQAGGIISEYAPGTAPKSCFFPMRNRIISALSDIVIVIEAREKSGSLITADMALEQGKEIYALPGRVTDSLSHGCNRLIRQGAGIILSPEEFIRDLSVNYSLHGVSSLPGTDSSAGFFSSLSAKEKELLSIMDFTPTSVGMLQSKSDLSFSDMMNTLMDLTLKGAINQVGCHYVRAC